MCVCMCTCMKSEYQQLEWGCRPWEFTCPVARNGGDQGSRGQLLEGLIVYICMCFPLMGFFHDQPERGSGTSHWCCL